MYISLIIIILAVFFACISQRKRVPATHSNSNSIVIQYNYFNSYLFLISFFLLFILCFLSKTGDDIPAYVYYYSNWTWKDLLDFEVETGYKLLCLLLRIIFRNPYVGIGVIKFISLALVFQSIYMLRDRLNVGFAVFAYVCILYVHAFHLLRIMIAVGLVYLAYAYIIKGKKKQGFILLLLSAIFHYSSIIVFIAYIIYRIVGKVLTIKKLIIVSLVLLFVYFNVEILVKLGVSNLGILSKYSIYITNIESGSGLAQLILFLPILYIILTLNPTDKNDNMYILCSIIGIMSFFAGSLGYIFEVIGRSTYYFNYFTIIYCATMPVRKDKVYVNVGFTEFNIRSVLSFVYILLYLAFTYVIPGKSVDIITEYEFFWA
ncbi:MAG: EpsG family protein [Ruminococcus sp.]|nr:EpsG family protein [Ruminococcus sp.]